MHVPGGMPSSESFKFRWLRLRRVFSRGQKPGRQNRIGSSSSLETHTGRAKPNLSAANIQKLEYYIHAGATVVPLNAGFELAYQAPLLSALM